MGHNRLIAAVGICLLLGLLFNPVQVQSYERKFPSMCLSNWKDSLLLWAGPRDNPNEQPVRPMGLTGFRKSPHWSINGLTTDSFILQWGNTRFFDPSLWDGAPSFSASTGEFITPITSYNQTALPFYLSRSYYFPPQEDFYLVKYHFENSKAGSIVLKLLDYFVSDICPSESSGYLTGLNNASTVDTFTIDRSSCDVPLLLGSYSDFNSPNGGLTMRSFAVGPATGSNSPLEVFQNLQVLDNTSFYQGSQISIGIHHEFLLQPGEIRNIFVMRSLTADYNDFLSNVLKVIEATPDNWVLKNAVLYSDWLNSGIQPTLSSDHLQLYQNSLIFMKNSQNPDIGTFVASFHPRYLYKNWGRDGAFNAMALDAAGYHAEAEKHFLWMAQCQMRDDGGFHTCYDWFTGSVVGFVEPQYDSAGAFLLGVYHHYTLTKDLKFLQAVYSKVKSIEYFYIENINPIHLNLVPSDYSIWEESSDPTTGNGLPTSYFTFTQSLSFAGLYAAAKIEEALGNEPMHQQLIQLSNSLAETVENLLWNEKGGYYYRSIWSDSITPDVRVDSSSVAVIFSGLTQNTTRALLHLTKVNSALSKLNYGLARYEGDIFFYASKFNPGGQETSGPEPAWGVVTMFAAWAENYLNIDFKGRLDWMLKYSAPGFLPVGEAIDGLNGEFVMSSCPDIYEHGAVYVWSTLIDQGLALGPNPRSYQ